MSDFLRWMRERLMNEMLMRTKKELTEARATIADLTAQRDASISDVVRMGTLYDKCAAKDATIADLTGALSFYAQPMAVREKVADGGERARAALARAEGMRTE